MKNTSLKIAGLILLIASIASADPINGRITFSGGVTFNSPDIALATAATSWSSPVVSSVAGDFATHGVWAGEGVSIAAPWSFNSGAISNFWTVGEFNFDLISSAVVMQGDGFVYVRGTGTVTDTNLSSGLTPYIGTWSFTSQDPSAGGVFSFSGGSAVPDGGMTALLLGLGLLGLGLAVRRQKAV